MPSPFSFWKWSPRSIPGLKQWYSAQSVDASGNAVDLSGNANPGLQTNLIVAANVITGLSVFRFNGTSSTMELFRHHGGVNFSAFAFVLVPQCRGRDQ